MKTITEFAVVSLKNAAKTRQELVTAGKTPEELPQALGEALKIEGEKLAFLQNALEVVGEKYNDLKRVVVLTLGEGEKAPGRAQQKGEHYFLVEYYPSLEPQRGRGHRDERGGKGDKRGGKRGGRRGDRDGKHGRGRPDRDAAPRAAEGASPGQGEGQPGGEHKRRPRRGRRPGGPKGPADATVNPGQEAGAQRPPRAPRPPRQPRPETQAVAPGPLPKPRDLPPRAAVEQPAPATATAAEPTQGAPEAAPAETKSAE